MYKWTKPFTKTIYIVLQTSIGLATPNIENECWTSYETLESFGEMKLMMKFCLCFDKITELWNLFLSFPWEMFFRYYFRQLFVYLALRKCKNDCKIYLKLLWYRFLSTKPWNISVGFRLNSSFVRLLKTYFKPC